MDLEVRWTIRGEEALVDLSGTITLGGGDVTLRETVDALLAKNSCRIALDLGKVSYVDSAGLGELVASLRRVADRGGTLRILNPSSRVSELLRLTQLGDMFGLDANEERLRSAP